MRIQLHYRKASYNMGVWMVLLFLVGLGWMSSGVQAGQVNFSSPLNRLNVDAEGYELDGDFVFELGAFTPGFKPTIGNMHQWRENWTSATQAVYNPETGIFAGQFNYDRNVAPFLVSNQGWVWGFRDSGDPEEWVLIGSSSWRWPSANNPVPAFWSLNANNPVAVVGYVDSGAKGLVEHLRTMAVYSGASPKLLAKDWRKLVFADKLDDPDTELDKDYSGDGVSNLLKFALGEDPHQASGARLPEFVFDKENGESFAALKIKRNPVANVKYMVEYSTDLEKWFKDGLVTVTDEAEWLVVRDSVPRSERPRLFMRLLVLP